MRDGKDRVTPVEASSKEHVVGPWDGRTGMVVARRSTVAYSCLALQPSRCPSSTPRTRHAALFSRRRLCASMEKTGLVVHATMFRVLWQVHPMLSFSRKGRPFQEIKDARAPKFRVHAFVSRDALCLAFATWLRLSLECFNALVSIQNQGRFLHNRKQGAHPSSLESKTSRVRHHGASNALLLSCPHPSTSTSKHVPQPAFPLGFASSPSFLRTS